MSDFSIGLGFVRPAINFAGLPVSENSLLIETGPGPRQIELSLDVLTKAK